MTRTPRMQTLLDHRYLPWLLVSVCALLIVVEAVIARTSQFSPDSWSYIELAKTVFSERFFEFNTYRSYVSDRHSASFPLGYPVLLALAHLPFGAHPAAGVVLNFALALASAALLIGIARRLGQPSLIQAILAGSLLLYPQYVNEILSARAIPAALLCFIAALWLCLSHRHFAAGLLLGLSALVRFDFLANALLFLIGFAVLFSRGRIRCIAAMTGGLFIGLLPWIVYSLWSFDRGWVSDNSWVALSATPALVLDYPAAASTTLMTDPAQWLGRILGNVPGLLSSLAAAAPGYPAFIVVVCVLLWSAWQRHTALHVNPATNSMKSVTAPCSSPFKGEVRRGMGHCDADQTHPHPSPGVSASLRRSAGAERCSAKPLLHPLEGEGATEPRSAFHRQTDSGLGVRSVAVLALATASLAPYILTGYFDARYFTLFFVTLSVVVLSKSNLRAIPMPAQATASLLFALVAAVTVVRLLEYTAAQSEAYAARAGAENALIARLSACHAVKPETRFIFAGEALNVSFKYGALTGNRAAAIPSNFHSMDASTRASYFSRMHPYLLVDRLSPEFQCN